MKKTRNIIRTIAITVPGIIVGSALLFLTFECIQVMRYRSLDERAFTDTAVSPLTMEAIPGCTITPVVDYYAARGELQTEPGVSWLVRAGDRSILMDVGYNAANVHPSPLLRNLKTLGIAPAGITDIFISHNHLDHVGGMASMRSGRFTLSPGPVELGAIPVYTPVPLPPAAWHPLPLVTTVTAPRVLGRGFASIGPIASRLFMMGRTEEQALALNVRGKGIVLVIGCGHQGIERIIARTRQLFPRERIYAIIGGLHFPVNGGRIYLGPLNIQKIASDQPPWRGITGDDVDRAIRAIQEQKPSVVALSGHDSSDWALARFAAAFGARYQTLRAGGELKI